jgi:hypothetical protein
VTSANYSSDDVAAGSSNVYAYDEGGIDYNAGLVGALGYIVSKVAPVDTSKFGTSTGIASQPRITSADLLVGTTDGGMSVSLGSKALVSGFAVDLQGRKAASLTAQGTGLNLATTGLARGVYNLVVRTADGQSLARTVVVR